MGKDGLAEGFKKGSALFDLTTNAPSMVRKTQLAYAEKGLHLLDAPVSGGPAGAKSGRLALWSAATRPFSRSSSRRSTPSATRSYIGPIGAGSVAKLVHNCAGYSIQTALAEVFSMGVKAGVEPLALWEAVRSGAQGRSRSFDRLAHVS